MTRLGQIDRRDVCPQRASSVRTLLQVSDLRFERMCELEADFNLHMRLIIRDAHLILVRAGRLSILSEAASAACESGHECDVSGHRRHR